MLTLHVNNKDYKVEFTFEAAESETVNKAFEFFSGGYMLKALPDIENTNDTKAKIAMLDASFNMMADASRYMIDFLYMGLLENHGPYGAVNQDIQTRDDAKKLYKQFAKENKDSDLAMHTGMFEALKKQMEEDGFFKRIGVDVMMDALVEAPKETKKQSAKKQSK